MTRYIDADGLLEELKLSSNWHAENSREFSLLFRDIVIVNEQPTADVVPVRHGKWIPWKYHNGYRCDKCNEPVDNKHNYCPNCGAKMDGEYETD